jgi:zinc transporter ZupT
MKKPPYYFEDVSKQHRIRRKLAERNDDRLTRFTIAAVFSGGVLCLIVLLLWSFLDGIDYHPITGLALIALAGIMLYFVNRKR